MHDGAQPFDGAVLAGGASRRMGRDKAFLDPGGRPLVRVAVDALVDGGAADVVVVGGDGEALGELGLTVVADRWPAQGPLGGVVTALDRPGRDTVVIVACDHPATVGEAVASVAAALAASDADVAVPVVDGRRQWMHAGWTRRAAPALARAFDAGVRSLHGAAGSLRVVDITGGDPAWYADLDRPSDVSRWRDDAGSRDWT